MNKIKTGCISIYLGIFNFYWFFIFNHVGYAPMEKPCSVWIYYIIYQQHNKPFLNFSEVVVGQAVLKRDAGE